MADLITTAYLAIGAHAAIREHGAVGELLDMAEIEFVQQVIDYEPLLISLLPEECHGVFDYEVSEEFGERVGAAILLQQPYDALAIACELIDAMQGEG